MTEALRKPSPRPRPSSVLPETAQRAASDPLVSAWVSASAGSGKTTVLTGRMLRLLLSGVRPEKILCLTFTRAAAAEMAIRVTEKLSLWATCGIDVLRKELDALEGRAPEPRELSEARRLFSRALNCPGGLRIRTIHAFAQEILRRFPIEAGLPPHFTVIEERDAAELDAEALHGLLRDAAAYAGPALRGARPVSGHGAQPLAAAPESAVARALKVLAAALGDDGLKEVLFGMLSERARLAEAGSVEKIAKEVRDRLGLENDTRESICTEVLASVAAPNIKDAAQKLLHGTASFAARGRAMLEWLALDRTARLGRFDDYCGFFLTGAGEPFAKFADKALLAKHPGLDDTLRREAQRLIHARARIEAAETAERTAALVTLGHDLIRRTEALKARRSALDYDDLILRAEALLRRPGIAPWVLYKLDGGLDHILVDEAQDTSAAQWRIIAALADEFFVGASARNDKNRTLFAVGDEKQSIFSFQHADPEAFEAMRAAFANKAEAAGKAWREEALNFSFRSAPAILQAVDAIFALPEARAGVAMDALRHFPAPPRINETPKLGRVELWPLIAAPEKAEREAWSLPGDYDLARDREAELAAKIADTIKGFIDRNEALPGRATPIVPGDIMILLRRRGRFADLMVRALKSRRIAVTGVDRMHLAKQLPVMDLIALLQFALLPEDDLNLAALLRSPLLGLTEDDLMALCIGRTGTLWQALKEKARKYGPAHDYLAAILARADFATPFAFLSAALNRPCPGDAQCGRRAFWARLGTDALDPIDELLAAALAFDQTHPPSLQSFLRWLTAADTDVKRELDRGAGEDGGQVRIMTVHAAKGLEAPIVFLPDAAGLPRAQDVPALLWHDGAPFYLPRKPTAGLPRRLWDAARQKQMEEYRRLFYVALTRASHRLYIAGWEAARNEGRGERLRGAQSETVIGNEESWYALALKALQPLHEPHAVGRTDNPPLVAFADPEMRIEAKETKFSQPAKPPLPAWALQMAGEERASPRPLSPSALAASPLAAVPDAVFTRGRIIHRLLQSLPDVEPARRAEVTARFLANPRHDLDPERQKDIAAEVLKLLAVPEYASLFGPGSRAEVPLIGRIGDQPIAGQVDRLCVTDDGIFIVDYKTGTPPADIAAIPDAYRRQLSSYRAILRQIYPDKPVRCFLLWTYGPRLTEVPAES